VRLVGHDKEEEGRTRRREGRPVGIERARRGKVYPVTLWRS
jgi:hypothetical protein